MARPWAASSGRMSAAWRPPNRSLAALPAPSFFPGAGEASPAAGFLEVAGGGAGAFLPVGAAPLPAADAAAAGGGADFGRRAAAAAAAERASARTACCTPRSTRGRSSACSSRGSGASTLLPRRGCGSPGKKPCSWPASAEVWRPCHVSLCSWMTARSSCSKVDEGAIVFAAGASVAGDPLRSLLGFAGFRAAAAALGRRGGAGAAAPDALLLSSSGSAGQAPVRGSRFFSSQTCSCIGACRRGGQAGRRMRCSARTAHRTRLLTFSCSSCRMASASSTPSASSTFSASAEYSAARRACRCSADTSMPAAPAPTLQRMPRNSRSARCRR